MAYETIEVKPATAAIGAEISGVDLARPLGNQQFQEVHDALMAHQVRPARSPRQYPDRCPLLYLPDLEIQPDVTVLIIPGR